MAWVTGAGSGIGRSTAQALTAAVVIGDNNAGGRVETLEMLPGEHIWRWTMT